MAEPLKHSLYFPQAFWLNGMFKAGSVATPFLISRNDSGAEVIHDPFIPVNIIRHKSLGNSTVF